MMRRTKNGGKRGLCEITGKCHEGGSSCGKSNTFATNTAVLLLLVLLQLMLQLLLLLTQLLQLLLVLLLLLRRLLLLLSYRH